MTQAGDLRRSRITLKALEAAAAIRMTARKVVAKMKELPTDDPLFGKGPIRADGRRLIPAYLFEVKSRKNRRARGTTTSCSPRSRRSPRQAARGQRAARW